MCGSIIISLIIQLLIASAVLHLAAWMTGHGNRGFGTAIACTIVMYIVGILIGVAVGILACLAPCIALTLGVIVGFLVTISIIQSMYETGWGNAFLIWLVTVIVQIIMVLIFHGAEIS